MATNANAQEDIAPFRLTDVSGEFEVRYILDERRNQSFGPAAFFGTSNWAEKLMIRTRSYVYHPAFLQMSIGGGPILVQSDFQSGGGRSSDQETLFNLDASFAFLSRRPYPFTLYYGRSFPQTATGLSGNISTETNDYGIRGAFLPAKSRFRLHWDAGHREVGGSGSGATVDDENDRASIRALIPYGDQNEFLLSASWDDRVSSSGNVGLPIQESRSTSTQAELDANNRFGSNANLGFRQSLVWLRQDIVLATETRLDRLNYRGSLSWDYSPKTDYFVNLRYNDVERSASWSRSGGVNAGFKHDLPGGFFIAGAGNFSHTEAPGFAADSSGANMSVSYQRSLPFGTLSASAGIGLNQTDQESSTDTVTVFDEALVLAGTGSVALSQDFVVAETPVVTNEVRTQTYVEGLDYRLVIIGGTTNIERLVTGNILDGQTVLVTYDFLTGGTVGYDMLNQQASLNLQMFKYFSAFLTYSDANGDITSGSAVTPLNDTRAFELGGRVDYPVSQRWSVGGDYRFFDRDSEISSSAGSRFKMYARVRLTHSTAVQLSMQSNKVDNADSPEDVNRLGYTVNVTSRLPGSLLLTYFGQYNEDDGGSINRDELRHGLRLDWGYRLVRFTLQADQVTVTQGDFEQTYKRVNARLTRHF